MNKTLNYDLNLPEKSEQYNIRYFNENNEVIDEQLKTNSDNINIVNGRLLEAVNDLNEKIDNVLVDAKDLTQATGVLPVSKGGTGKTTTKDGFTVLAQGIDIRDNVNPSDADRMFVEYNGYFTRRPITNVWEYFKNKISSVLGLTATAYGGKAATAINDSKSQAITSYIRGLSISGKTITYTKGDGTTGTITTQDSTYTHPTTPGNKHIPSGGSSGQILGYSANGTAAWKSLDTVLSTSSTNPITNKAVTAAINKKLEGSATYKHVATPSDTNTVYTVKPGEVVVAFRLRTWDGYIRVLNTVSGFYVNGYEQGAGKDYNDQVLVFYNNGSSNVNLGVVTNQMNYLFVKLYD